MKIKSHFLLKNKLFNIRKRDIYVCIELNAQKVYIQIYDRVVNPIIMRPQLGYDGTLGFAVCLYDK